MLPPCCGSYLVIDREKAGLIVLAPMAIFILAVGHLETIKPLSSLLLEHLETTADQVHADKMTMDLAV